jgi:four helix bundle protein
LDAYQLAYNYFCSMNSTELEERLITFSVNVSKFLDSLPEKKLKKNLREQLERSSTSPALNYGEARAAESTKDFIHKMRIVLKELRESFNCLRMIRKLIEDSRQLDELINEANELVSIFVISVKTAEKNNMIKHN